MFWRIINLIGIELEKLVRQKLFYIALVLIALAVIISVLILPQQAGSGGFASLSRGCLAGFQIGSIFLLLFASLSISSEASSGTLRMILLRPFRRSELIIAKIFLLGLLVLVVMALVELLGVILVESHYGFGPVVDSSNPSYQYLDKDVMLRYSLYSFILVLLPLMAVISFGLFISVIIENMGGAIVLSILIYLMLDYFVIPVFTKVAPYLFPYYTTLYFRTLNELSQGVLTEIWRFRVIDLWLGLSGEANFTQQLTVAKSILIPLGYSIVFFILSIVIFKKKDVLV